MVRPLSPYLSAAEACQALGVTAATLYAYVSRGMLRSEPDPAASRRRRYARQDVEALIARRTARRDPAAVAGRTLDWGMPVIESAITTIDRGRLRYRGHDAVELAGTRRFEEVARLLAVGGFTAPGKTDAPPSDALETALARRSDLGAIERCQVLLPMAGAADPAAWDLRPAAAWRAGRAILRLVASGVAGVAADGDGPAAILARGWRLGADQRPALEVALVLCADHELNASTFTARCVASAGGNPFDAVAAALAALKGHRHGGLTARIEVLLDDVARHGARRAVGERLRRGETVPGFGHPLYPDGDPRASMLLATARQAARPAVRLAAVEELVVVGEELLGEQPSLDLGLVALSRALALPPGAALGLFAAGRSAGWVAHVIEEYGRGVLIRPRARYVGVAAAR